MNKHFRWLNGLFILTLLLGFVPAVGNAPRAQAAPVASDVAVLEAPPAPQARPSQNPAAAPAPAAPQAAQSTAFPPPSGLSIDERLRLNTDEGFRTGVVAFDNVNGYGYFISNEVIVKVNLADGARVGAIGFWPEDLPGGPPDEVIVALADPQRDMLYFGTDGTPARIVRVRISTFKRIDALTLPEGLTLTGGAVLAPDGNSAYLSTKVGNGSQGGVIQVRLPDFAMLRGTSQNIGAQDTLTMDEANGWIYMGTYTRVNLADMSWESLPQPSVSPPLAYNIQPLVDVTRGLVYYGYNPHGVTTKIRRFRLSDATEVTPSLELPASIAIDILVPTGIAISPDHAYAYFQISNDGEWPQKGYLIRVNLASFTYEDSHNIGGAQEPTSGGHIRESLVMNPGSGTVYLGWAVSDDGYDYDSTITRYWGDHSDGGVATVLSADQEYAKAIMLDTANGYAYSYGELRAEYQPWATQYVYDYGLTRVTLSDFSRDESLKVFDSGAETSGPEYLLGHGIDLLNGKVHLAFESDSNFYLKWVNTAEFRYIQNLAGYFYSPRQVLYKLPQGVVYGNSEEPWRGLFTENQMTITHQITTPLDMFLGIDTLHDHLYAYQRTQEPYELLKFNGADLSLAATLPMTGSIIDQIGGFFALDPANDAAYTFGRDDSSPSVSRFYKLRLSDLSIVMSRTYTFEDPTPIAHLPIPAIVDPTSGYSYYLGAHGGTSCLVQFRLDDLTVTDFVELDVSTSNYSYNYDLGIQKMALDPEEGTIYIAASEEILKIGLSGGKSVTPASDVPYHGTVTYTLNLAGHLTLTDTHVVLTDTLPAEVDFLNWVEQPAGATVADDVIHWSGQLNPRQVVTLTFTAQHNGNYNETVHNTATYSGTVVQRTMRAAFTVESPPPLPLVKTVTPAQASPGDPVVYTLRFTNTTGVAATGVVITDTLPALLESPQVSSSIAITVRTGTQYVWVVENDLDALASGTITITGNLADDAPDGPVTNTATLVGLIDGTAHQHSSSAVLDVNGSPQTPKLAISKTAEEMSDSPLLANDRILYTIRVTNTTTGTLIGLIVTDTLPAGVTYFRTPKGSPRPVQTGTPTVWTLASLAAGASQTFKVIVKATGDVSPLGDNVAQAACAEDAAPVSASANLDDSTVQEALELLKDAVDVNGAPLLVDDVIRYTIRITNTHASVTLTSVVVTDTLPAGTVLVSATQAYTGTDTLWWQVGTLAPGATWTATIDQRVDGTANPIAGNHAAVWCDQQDAQETGNILPPDPVIKTALELGKTAEEMSAPPLLENDRILYTIRVTNTSTGTLTNLIVTDTLPAGVTYFNTPKGSPRPVQTGNPVLWTQASLDVGVVKTYKVIVKVDGTANPIGVNQVQATCAEEALPAAATAQVPGDGVHEPGIVVSGTVNGGGANMRQQLQVTRNGLAVGDLLTYTLNVANTNATHTMHNVAVTITVPSGTELVSATPSGYSGSIILPWHVASLTPGMDWPAQVVVRVINLGVGPMTLAAQSDEQSPVEITIGQGSSYSIYLPLVLRNLKP